MGDENPIRTLGDYPKPSHEGYRNTIELPIGNNVVIALPEDVPSTSDCRLIKLENQVQCLMEAHLAPTQPTQVNKITTLCEIYSGPHDTQYCMENPEQAFVEYASSRTDEVGGKWHTLKPEKNSLGDTYNPSWKSHPNLSFFARSYPTEDPQCSTHVHGLINAVIIYPKQQSDSCDDRIDENEEEETDYPENIHVNPPTPPDPSISFTTKKVLILNSFGKWIMKKEMRMISNDGIIPEFLGYTSSKEEEDEEKEEEEKE
uniref:MAK10-like protein n=1 Tax=Tanacetum cinerariifolium TaxID=118510 RepID=A0A6L2KBR1_TANCI|nr:MAK10-like protein [Tanacetum cinerariifolium]